MPEGFFLHKIYMRRGYDKDVQPEYNHLFFKIGILGEKVVKNQTEKSVKSKFLQISLKLSQYFCRYGFGYVMSTFEGMAKVWHTL